MDTLDLDFLDWTEQVKFSEIKNAPYYSICRLLFKDLYSELTLTCYAAKGHKSQCYWVSEQEGVYHGCSRFTRPDAV
jgi:hypothetical protein